MGCPLSDRQYWWISGISFDCRNFGRQKRLCRASSWRQGWVTFSLYVSKDTNQAESCSSMGTCRCLGRRWLCPSLLPVTLLLDSKKGISSQEMRPFISFLWVEPVLFIPLESLEQLSCLFCMEKCDILRLVFRHSFSIYCLGVWRVWSHSFSFLLPGSTGDWT